MKNAVISANLPLSELVKSASITDKGTNQMASTLKQTQLSL